MQTDRNVSNLYVHNGDIYDIPSIAIPVLLETINKNFSKFSTLCGTRKLSP